MYISFIYIYVYILFQVPSMAIPPPLFFKKYPPNVYSAYPQLVSSPLVENLSHLINFVWYYTYVVNAKGILMKSNKLRIEFHQILSDMLLMQYRIEVLRRNVQIVSVLDESFGVSVGLHLDSMICDFVKLGSCDLLCIPDRKNWWER